ncbi:hypothetical protein B484DRAFT_433155 [Ochromonadaceae sp. CCMP2298]|nr:hypothetical protein B484DRAFT_433155 [Ochromonadaceae sp. CCMP2298]
MALKMWPRFLLAAASCTSSAKVSDELLARFIKDAADFKVLVLSAPQDEEDKPKENSSRDTTKEERGVQTTVEEEAAASRAVGLARLAKVFNAKEWEDLPSTRKVHKTKKARDKRFDGPSRFSKYD